MGSPEKSTENGEVSEKQKAPGEIVKNQQSSMEINLTKKRINSDDDGVSPRRCGQCLFLGAEEFDDDLPGIRGRSLFLGAELLGAARVPAIGFLYRWRDWISSLMIVLCLRFEFNLRNTDVSPQ